MLSALQMSRLFLISLILMSAPSCVIAADEQPNVIFILVDGLGYGTSSLADHWKNDAFDDHYWRKVDA